MVIASAASPMGEGKKRNDAIRTFATAMAAISSESKGR
jgi:hypothetical protein